MTIQLPTWIIPMGLSAIGLLVYWIWSREDLRSNSAYAGLGAAFSFLLALLWIAVVWAFYFAVLYWRAS